jgi:hypothetical protein
VVPSFSANTSVPMTFTVYVTSVTNSNLSPFVLYSNPITYTIT